MRATGSDSRSCFALSPRSSSMLTPSVSVVIPSHNRAQLVMRALDSVRSQTYPADEILVVDDGSEDDTLKRIRLEQQDVHVLEQPHSGVSTARNLGIREATGDWIAFLDRKS